MAGSSRASACDQLIQNGGQAVQLYQVCRSELGEDPITLGGQPDPDQPRVAAVGDPAHEASGLRPVDELDRAVVPQQQIVGEVADGRRLATRVALDGDQKLVLYVRQAGRPGLVLAPPLEPAQAVTKRQQVLEVLAGWLLHATTSVGALRH